MPKIRSSTFRLVPLNAVLALLLAAPSLAAQPEVNIVRLTPEQYQRAIHDTFGPNIHVGDNKVDPGVRDEGLVALGNRKLTMGSSELERDEALAQEIAAQVIDPKRRASIISCQPALELQPDDQCAGQFLARAGRLLFRRPLTTVELKGYVATQHTQALERHSFYSGLAAAIAQMLITPDFLFRVETSTADPAHPDHLQLDADSRASRLSFFLWNSAPDSELLDAAQSGRLMSSRGLKQQVERMLSSPRIEDGLRAFFIDMLGFSGIDEDPGFDTLSIDTTFYPNFTPNVRRDAEEQTLRTIVDQLLNKNADYRDLFVTRDTFLTPELAAVYGVPLPRSQELGGAVPWVPYHFADDAPYVGLLTQISFLSLHSHPGRTSPTRRGKALREIFLCQKVPPPPGNVDFSLVQNTNDPRYKTVRQRLTVHRNEPMCAGCHKIMDPLGLSFEHFDTAGEYRPAENGAPIDATGELNGHRFDGVAQLAQILRDDPATTSCLLNRLYAFGTTRRPTPQEQSWLASQQPELAKEGVRWRELIRRITLNQDFYTNTSRVSPALEAQR
jgi:uncharacterized protein DUF1592/uncharacterized protein DUF1588/uncharacterized protein DUF1595/uncharacterized protein DUF1585